MTEEITQRKDMSMSSKPTRIRSTDAEATPAETEEVPVGTSPRDQQIRRRAYEIYLERGELQGHELDDWLQAEGEKPGD
jgi:hypothetical protein